MSNNAPPSIFDCGYYLFEDFLTNDSVADAAVGKNRWEIDAISSGADTLSYETAGGETLLRMTGGGAGDGDGTALSLKDDSVTVSNAGGYFRTRVRIPNIAGNALAGNNFRIGLTDVVTSSEPAVGIWIDCDAGVLSLDCASANGDLTEPVSIGDTSVLTSGTTMILGTTYNMEVVWHGNNGNADPGPDTVELFVNGIPAAKIENALIDSAETMDPKITHWGDTGGASTLELDVFGYELKSHLAR